MLIDLGVLALFLNLQSITSLATAGHLTPIYKLDATIFNLVSQIDVPTVQVSTPHLDLTSHLNPQVVIPGEEFSLVLDIVPSGQMHIYAPSVTKYKPLMLNFQSQPGLVLGALEFPESEDYYFEPLDEHVNVYMKPFRIVQKLVVDMSGDVSGSLDDVSSMEIKATLQYQACDETVCYSPQVVPLLWTVKFDSFEP